jgi:hypothetical protein
MKAQQDNAAGFKIRTQLRAGGNCYPHDTNCVLLEQNGSPVMLGGAPMFSSCGQGFPGSGAVCITLQAGLKDTMKKNTSCMQC